MSQAHADSHSAHSIKPYLVVFGALMVLTVVTVAVSHIDMKHPWNLIVGITIAVIKASLVALYFMHLKGERMLIWGLLALTGFFALVLWLLPTFDFHDLTSIGRVEPIAVSSGNHGAAHEPAQKKAETHH